MASAGEASGAGTPLPMFPSDGSIRTVAAATGAAVLSGSRTLVPLALLSVTALPFS